MLGYVRESAALDVAVELKLEGDTGSVRRHAVARATTGQDPPFAMRYATP